MYMTQRKFLFYARKVDQKLKWVETPYFASIIISLKESTYLGSNMIVAVTIGYAWFLLLLCTPSSLSKRSKFFFYSERQLLGL